MKLLNLIGILATGQFLLGKFTESVSDKVSYSFRPIRLPELGVVIRGGSIKVKTPLRFELHSKLPVTISAKTINFSVSHGGRVIGQANTTTDIKLIPDQKRELSFDLFIGAGSFLDQVQEHLRGKGSVFDPIGINGNIVFDNGLTLPINRTINILSVE